MKYLDEFREPELARRLITEIRRMTTKRWAIMEVCGGQTHSLLRYGIEEELRDCIELLHGPGCPVCVTPAESIDFACELAMQQSAILTSFGDMLRVPGSQGSLQTALAQGGDVRLVCSPIDALRIAEQNSSRQVVFFAVGFETTAPATALALLEAERRKITNFSLLVAHVRVQPAMEQIAASPDCRVDGFLAAGHVCTVVGADSYAEFVERFHLPVVVTGFEPIDLLTGIRECVAQLESGHPALSNQYARSVRMQGNPAAQRFVDQVYEVNDRQWRGIGVVPRGGLFLRSAWREWDAEGRFVHKRRALAVAESQCQSAGVLTGRIKPPQCAHFGLACTPETPLGAPMVSSEGACAAYFRYRREPVLTQLETA
jgi:hydrogenase expression/formation protein HypD